MASFVAQPCPLLSLPGHWRYSLFKFKGGYFWLHWQTIANIIGWFGCSVPFTGYFFVVWILQFLFWWDSRLIFFIMSYWKLNLMCWPPPMLNRKPSSTVIHTLTIILRSNHSKAVVPGQDGRTASLGSSARLFFFFFFVSLILTFGPIEIKAIDLTCALCFSNMYYHNAFNFWHITLRSFPKVLFLQLSLCVQCVTGV